MKYLVGILSALAMQNAAAQVALPNLIPYEETDTYKCFGPNVGYGTKGAWLWYICDPWKNAPVGTPSRVIWTASPYPIRMDLIGSRLETINKAADKKTAIQNAWKRFVVAAPDDPALLEVKKEMIEKDKVPIKP